MWVVYGEAGVVVVAAGRGEDGFGLGSRLWRGVRLPSWIATPTVDLRAGDVWLGEVLGVLQ